MDLSLPSKSDLLTNSRLNDRAVCPRKEYYGYGVGVRPEATEALRVGSAFHNAAELLKGGNTIGYAFTQLEKNAEALKERYGFADESCHRAEVECAKLKAMAFAWKARYMDPEGAADDIGPVKVFANELEFNLPLINPQTGCPSRSWRLGGKIDGIVEHTKTGALALLEHKTTSETLGPESDYWLRLRIDQQLSIYMWAARTLGYEVEYAIYDVVRVPTISPGTIKNLDAEDRRIVVHEERPNVRAMKKNGEPYLSANPKLGHIFSTRPETMREYYLRVLADMQERPDHYFSRRTVYRSEEDIQDCLRDIWTAQKGISSGYAKGWHPKNTAACRFPYRCKYLSTCANHVDLRKVTPDGFVRLDDVHPELGEANE